MKKPFFKTKVGKFLLGAIDEVPGGSIVSNLLEDTEDNPTGKIDWSKGKSQVLIGAMVLGGILILTGAITFDQLIQLIGVAG